LRKSRGEVRTLWYKSRGLVKVGIAASVIENKFRARWRSELVVDGFSWPDERQGNVVIKITIRSVGIVRRASGKWI
jgi:hypothetical protein